MRFRVIHALVAVCSVALFGPVGSARADLIVGDMSSTQNSGGTLGLASRPVGDKFTLGSSFTAIGLASVTFKLEAAANPAHVHATLWSNSGSLPGAAIADLGSLTIPFTGSYADYAFSPTLPFTLQPSTSYWVVLQNISGGPTNWRGTNNATFSLDVGGDPHATIPLGSVGASLDSGSSWFISGGVNNLLFSVQSVHAVVPLPPAGLAGLGALAGVAGFHRARRHCLRRA